MINYTLFQKSLKLNRIVKKEIRSIFLVILILICCFASDTFAKDVTLEWDLNYDADYYVVYWGNSSGDYFEYSENIDVQETEYTVTDISESDTWYFTVKAFNSYGNSSDFSDEMISYPTVIQSDPSDDSKGGCFIITTDSCYGIVSGNTFFMFIFRLIFCIGIMKVAIKIIKVG